MPTYEIHDNGGRPFWVDVTEGASIQGATVRIWKNMNDFDVVDGKFVTISKPRRHVMDIRATRVWIGKQSPNGSYDGLTDAEAEGNSILVRIGPKKYIFIGSEIYQFETPHDDVITQFYSNIGNNDVPYPYALGHEFVYVFLHREAIESTYFDMSEDIYEQYYVKERLNHCKYQTKCTKEKTDVLKSKVNELDLKRVPLKIKMIQKRD